MKIFPRTQMIFYFCLVLIAVPFFTIYLYDSSPDGSVSSEQSIETTLGNRLAELADRLKHAEMISQDRKKEINDIKKQMKHLRMMMASNRPTNGSQRLGNWPGDGRDGGEGHSSMNQDLLYSDLLQLPSIYHFLPHLLSSPDSLRPAFRRAPVSRTSASIVLGVPTVKRPVESYLLSTLQNLIDNLSDQERAETVIIVFIAETDMEYVVKTASEIESQLGEHVASGLVEIISPPQSFYPNLNDTRVTLGDSIERVKWRTKQNLDFAFLMMYAQPKATYYVQLEDDILSKPGYLSKMKMFAIRSTIRRKDWLILEFCNLGFIGKMFKSIDLSMFIMFFIMFRNDKPVDWLLEHFVMTKMCRIDKDMKDCKKQENSVWFQHNPSLFQHVGTHSSLKGKVQKLRDKAFGKLSLFVSHPDNPTADVATTVKHYKSHSLVRAYAGSDYFWGMTPKAGDNFTFKFNPEVAIERFLIRSGNIEHPEDKLVNASVEVLPSKPVEGPALLQLNRTADGYYEVGSFQLKGAAEGPVHSLLNPVKELRIRIKHDSEKWIIFSEIYIKVLSTATNET